MNISTVSRLQSIHMQTEVGVVKEVCPHSILLTLAITSLTVHHGDDVTTLLGGEIPFPMTSHLSDQSTHHFLFLWHGYHIVAVPHKTDDLFHLHTNTDQCTQVIENQTDRSDNIQTAHILPALMPGQSPHASIFLQIAHTMVYHGESISCLPPSQTL